MNHFYFLGLDTESDRQALLQSGRWPNGKLYYRFDNALSSDERKAVKNALYAFNVRMKDCIEIK